MSGYEIDLDEIGTLPGPMRTQQAQLVGGSTLPSPDTGVTTGETRSAVDHVVGLADAFAEDLGSIADGLDRALAFYSQTDGHTSWMLNLLGEALYE
ncbi:hypothetical protein [Nocardioides jensenii]|uniref:hypothetical protein n=1 Tax=Nocardioides jensenii TaxID=1843 RepID=UPI00082A7781|nr:hypothetical protein [Nocardioides jensenii]